MARDGRVEARRLEFRAASKARHGRDGWAEVYFRRKHLYFHSYAWPHPRDSFRDVSSDGQGTASYGLRTEWSPHGDGRDNICDAGFDRKAFELRKIRPR